MPRPLKVQRVDFSASDWLGGTSTLSLQECGLYIKICALIYTAGGPVSKADVRNIVPSVRYETFNSLLLRLVEKGKISFENGLIDQARCERELARARRRMAASSRTGDETESKPDSTVSAREPSLSNEINEVNHPITRVKGATQEPTTKDFKNLEGDLGRCAPSEPALPSEADKAEVDAMVEQTVATLRGEAPKGVRDPAAYQAAVKQNKFKNLVTSLNAWVGTGLDGSSARMAAWEVLAAAESAGSRSELAAAMRKQFDKLVEMFRAGEPVTEAAD